jgi:hypothetical protein
VNRKPTYEPPGSWFRSHHVARAIPRQGAVARFTPLVPVIGFGFRHSDFEFADWLDLVGFTWMLLQYQ